MTNRDHELLSALENFFASPVSLPESASDVTVGEIWLEERGEWQYPWRITGHRQGYPCGEPRKKLKADDSR